MSVLSDIQSRHATGDQFTSLRAVHLIWTCSSAAPFHKWFDTLAAIEKAPNLAYFHTHLFSTESAAPNSSEAQAVSPNKAVGAVSAIGDSKEGDERVRLAAAGVSSVAAGALDFAKREDSPRKKNKKQSPRKVWFLGPDLPRASEASLQV
jgi:hypothetical protein